MTPRVHIPAYHYFSAIKTTIQSPLPCPHETALSWNDIHVLNRGDRDALIRAED